MWRSSAQPDWQSADAWRQFGRPRLFFGISAGNMDSMINHYTANKKVRNDDAYSPGGQIGLRPDRATIPYCQRAREAFPGVPVIAGGVEASLRRLAHYDYWSDTVRRAIMLDAKADLVVFGMGEHQIVTIARRLAAGETVKDLRDMRGVAYAKGASESQDNPRARDRAAVVRRGQGRQAAIRPCDQDHSPGNQPRSTPGRSCNFTIARRSSATRRRCRSARTTWTGSTAFPTRVSRTRCTKGEDPGIRSRQGFGDLDARLLRRLHVLLDHGAPGADHPVALARTRCSKSCGRWGATRRFRAWSPTWAGRPPTCTR